MIVLAHRVPAVYAAEKKIASWVIYPFQWTVDAPFRFGKWIRIAVTSHQQLARENEALRIHQTLLQWQLQQLLALEKENVQLRQLLQSSAELSSKVSVARVYSVALNPREQRVAIDQGEKSGVFLGQPIFDAYGLMGQIVDITPLNSHVLLITDEQSAVPVENTRNGIRAIAVGLGASGELGLIHTPEVNPDIQVGDYFVTSGLDQRYPSGYPVGKVVRLQYNKVNHPQERVIVTPAAHLNQSDQVLIVWPTQHGAKQVKLSQPQKNTHSKKTSQGRKKHAGT